MNRRLEKRNRGTWTGGALLLTAGLVFMVVGFMRGEVDTVFIKAVNICLECIGIG